MASKPGSMGSGARVTVLEAEGALESRKLCSTGSPTDKGTETYLLIATAGSVSVEPGITVDSGSAARPTFAALSKVPALTGTLATTTLAMGTAGGAEFLFAYACTR